MKCFDNARGVTVPRCRFLPVKKTSDLLLVRSNLYARHAGALYLNAQREFQTVPLIKLGDEFTQVCVLSRSVKLSDNLACVPSLTYLLFF